MTRVYVPISQKNKLIKENQQRYVSKLVGDGWTHEGVTKFKDVFGNDIECVVLVGSGLHDGYENDKENDMSLKFACIAAV
jgi:hypothetical protein